MGQERLVHRFADPLDGADANERFGAKGVALSQMTRRGLPVPPGFTIARDAWAHYEQNARLPGELVAILRAEIAHLGSIVGARFGDASAPFLVSVRSGAASSMPGMLETVLDVGIDSDIARALSTRFGSARFGLDVRRRFVESYATVVLGVPREAFDALGKRDPRELDERALDALLADYDRLVRHEAEPIPDDPWTQLERSIEGVMRSWRAPRAQQYRRTAGIGDGEGTAVSVQLMVFGNAPERSGAGVAFSRNPSTGERALMGEWITSMQGDDIVSGRRTPAPLTSAQIRRGQRDDSLEGTMPEIAAQLREICETLETHGADAQDVEFTIERGSLFVLQARPAKRTARAAARIAVEMVTEGVLTRELALERIEPASLRQLFLPRFPDPQRLAPSGIAPIARGLAASPGAANGKIVLDALAAERFGTPSELVLVRAETSAEDVATMRAVAGVLTAAGGLTSHAAVVARAMGKPCVAGATTLQVDYVRRLVIARTEAGSIELAEGHPIAIDGTRGLVYAAAVPAIPAASSEHVETILEWADAARKIRVFAEVTAEQLARGADNLGADGAFVARAADFEAAMRAGGEQPLWVLASSDDELREAGRVLRADRDLLFTDRPDEARALCPSLSIAIPIGLPAANPPRARLVDLPNADAANRFVSSAIPSDASFVLRGEGAVSAHVLSALAGRVSAIVVTPLEVPIARLCAARA
jgi:pyruvate, orthophosphate dikinase